MVQKGLKKELAEGQNMTLVEHALTEAVSSKVFDKIFLSTDDGEIAQRGQSFEEVIIIRRPDF